MSNKAEQLTKKEEKYILKLQADLKFYDEYKRHLGDVKRIFLQKGPGAARQHIIDNADKTLQLACDELFHDLFTNL
jgi:hypothetical protein